MTTSRHPKPLPVPDADSRPFWEGTRQGKLMLMRCPKCKRLRWPARSFCNRCRTPGGEWAQLSGRGTLLSWTVQHHVLHPAWADDVPYTIVLVGLEEDLECRLVGNLRGVSPTEVRMGMPMEAVFEEASPEITLVQWRPRKP